MANRGAVQEKKKGRDSKKVLETRHANRKILLSRRLEHERGRLMNRVSGSAER